MVEEDNAVLRHHLIESPHEVFDNTPRLLEYYQRITNLIPFTEATLIWFIARGGSGKS
ncbi:MAG: hypothetical protein ACD_38C00048G0001, partial [uncultured bacterium]